MTVFFLTVYLVGTPISFIDSNAFLTYDACKQEGFRQVRDYQDGNIRATFDCEEVPVPPPPCEADYCI
jgi:hypothetical protein